MRHRNSFIQLATANRIVNDPSSPNPTLGSSIVQVSALLFFLLALKISLLCSTVSLI
jgi:hypothetical protein